MSCPVCGLGTVHRQYKNEDFEYKGHKKVIENYPVIVCSDCGEEFVSAQDAKPFEKDLTDFQREVDGLLKPDEIRTIRESLGYNQTEFARVMKVGVKNFARYENGLSPQSRYLDWLLRVLREHPEAMHVIDPKRSRTKDYSYWTNKFCQFEGLAQE